MDFGDKLQKMRKENKMSQEQLAEKLNVSRQAISKWEGGALPDVDNIVKISSFFDCSLDYLMSNKEEVKEDCVIGEEENEKKGNGHKLSWDIKWLLACLVPIGILLVIWILANGSDTSLHIKDLTTGKKLTKFLTYVSDHNIFFFIYLSLICLYVFITIKCIFPIKKEKGKKYSILRMGMWMVYMLGITVIHNVLLNPKFFMHWSLWLILFWIGYFLLVIFLEIRVANLNKT